MKIQDLFLKNSKKSWLICSLSSWPSMW